MKYNVMPGDGTRLLARTIRAARAYSGLSRDQLAAKISRSGEQVGRYERGDWKTDAPDALIIDAIARATGVPPTFIRQGFLDDGAAGATATPNGGTPPIPGETGRRLRGEQPSGEGPSQPGSEQDTDEAQGGP